jgi:hypothetical protein
MPPPQAIRQRPEPQLAKAKSADEQRKRQQAAARLGMQATLQLAQRRDQQLRGGFAQRSEQHQDDQQNTGRLHGGTPIDSDWQLFIFRP